MTYSSLSAPSSCAYFFRRLPWLRPFFAILLPFLLCLPLLLFLLLDHHRRGRRQQQQQQQQQKKKKRTAEAATTTITTGTKANITATIPTFLPTTAFCSSSSCYCFCWRSTDSTSPVCTRTFSSMLAHVVTHFGKTQPPEHEVPKLGAFGLPS